MLRQRSLTSSPGPAPGHGTRLFTFIADHRPPLQIRLFEEYCDDYALFTWPAAPVLAQFVWHHAPMFQDKNVIEIGCGTGLPGLTAAKVGANIILADRFCPKSRQLLEKNVTENGLQIGSSSPEQHSVQLQPLTWGCIDEEVLSLPQLDFILASDCFYDQTDFVPAVATITHLLEKGNQDCRCLTSYQVRNSEWSISCLLHEFGLQGKELPLHQFDAASEQLLGSTLPGSHTISLFEITVK